MGIAASKVHTWRQGVDQRIFHPGSKAEARQRLEKGDKYIFYDSKILLWVGRMVEVKGLDVLLDAARRLRESNTPFTLCLVGDGPLRQSLQAQCTKLNLANIVKFVGPRPVEQLGDW